MLSGRMLLAFSLALTGLAGALASLFLASYSAGTSLAALLALLTVVLLIACPWAALPTAIVGGVIAAEALGLTGVAEVTGLHAFLLGLGFLAVAARATLRRRTDRRLTTPADLPMALLAAAVAVGSAYGLARGNAPHEVLVAAYHLGVVPVYFFLATLTLTSPARLRLACLAFAFAAAPMAVYSLMQPDRNGGLLSALALTPALAAATRTSGSRRALAIVFAALFLLDVTLAGYRAVWVAAAIALVLLSARGGWRIRTLTLALAGLALTAALGVSLFTPTLDARADIAAEGLQRSGGYRIPEARLGLDALESSPVLGAGLGQVEARAFVPGLGVTDVGPVYHVFYVTVLANAGLIGLALLLWPLLVALRRRSARTGGRADAFRALLAGFAVAAAFAGPTDGHWELGLLAALSLIAARLEHAQAPRPSPRAAAAPIPRQAMPASSRPPVPATVAVIVVTYNSAAQIEECLPPLLGAGAWVVVVDNASTDETRELVAARFPEVRLIANPDNRGFARAVNQGLAASDADVVLLVNPDCVVPPETVRALVDQLLLEPDIGVVAPRLRGANGAIAVSVHPFENLASIVASRFGGSLLPVGVRRLLARDRRRDAYAACLGDDGRPVDVDWASGACLAVRGSLLRRLGGLDEGYFMYYEDEELCLQAWKAGARVVYLPAVEARHLGGASSSDPAQVWPHLYRSMLRFQARHEPDTYGFVRAAVAARAVLGIAMGLTRGESRRGLAWARIARLALVKGGETRQAL